MFARCFIVFVLIFEISGYYIDTYAGTGALSSGGDNGPASAAQLKATYGVWGTSDGYIYIADSAGHKIRKTTREDPHIITTYAGTGSAGDDSSGYAGNADLNNPKFLWINDAGTTLYFTDTGNNRVKQINLNNGNSSFISLCFVLTNAFSPQQASFLSLLDRAVALPLATAVLRPARASTI
jgi:sugar lactone lactonase YvrE